VKHDTRPREGHLFPLLAVLTALLVLLTAGCLVAFHLETRRMTETQQAQHAPVAHHYALICEDGDPFWDSVFSGAHGWAGENGVYLERFGSGLSVQYSRAERLKMAIAAGVDGILLQADESDEMGALIDRAVDAGIPVVTVMDDHYGSRQQSFVGLSSYTLGREYGRQIISCANKATRRALILMDANTDDSAQNILYTGITQTLANEGNHLTLTLDTLAVPDGSVFGPEQQVRDVLRQAEPPEIILCLDEQTTVCVLQTVVDLNMVGEVRIIGSYLNKTILDAISRGVISAAITVDTSAIGRSAAAALDQYVTTGSVSDFVTLDAGAVTRDNVKEYIKNEQ